MNEVLGLAVFVLPAAVKLLRVPACGVAGLEGFLGGQCGGGQGRRTLASWVVSWRTLAKTEMTRRFMMKLK